MLLEVEFCFLLRPICFEKSYGLQTSEIFEFLTVFLEVLWLYFNITVPILRLSVQSRNPILGVFSTLLATTCFSQKKSYGFRKVKFLNFDLF